MEKDLQRKTALVTGAASGIGKATALLYGQRGASVIVSDVNEAEGQGVVDQIVADGGVARFFRADVSDPEQCRQLVAQTVAAFGRLDIAFNNAGIGGERSPTADYSVAGWQHISTLISTAFSIVSNTSWRLC